MNTNLIFVSIQIMFTRPTIVVIIMNLGYSGELIIYKCGPCMPMNDIKNMVIVLPYY